MARTLEQIIAAEKPEVVAIACERAEGMLLDIHLAEQHDLIEKAEMDSEKRASCRD